MSLNPFAIPPLIASIYALGLGLFIFIARRKVWTNFVCSLTYYCVAIWLFGYAMLYITKNPTSLFWPKFVYVGVVFIGSTIYHFSVVLSDLKNQRRFVVLSYLIALCFIPFITFTDLFIAGLKRHFWGYHTMVNPFFHSIFLTFFLIAYGSALRNFFNEYKKKKMRQDRPLELNRIKYFLVQYFIGMFGAIDYLADWGFEFYPCGGYIVIVGISFVAYAIVKHRLLDIRVVITRTGVFIAVYALVLGLPLAIAGWLKDWLINTFGMNWWLTPLGLMAISATVGPFIYIYIERTLEKRLFQEQLHSHEILRQTAREMSRIHNFKKLLDLIVYAVTERVRIAHCAIYLFDTKSGAFLLEAGHNLQKEQQTSITKKSPAAIWFEKETEPLVYEEVSRKAQDNPAPIFKELEKEMRFLNATVIVPSYLEDKLLALFILGDKLSQKVYSSDDLEVFSILASHAALAIDNAMLYENMEDRIKQRTEELVQVQKQLVQAEKLATVGTLAGGVAHEINNPLTAILTNVQMLLASDTVDDKLDRESLELIEEATKRCRTIVQKLMTYARRPLETTQVFQINLLGVLKGVLSFIGYQLEQDNIKIVIDAKNEAYPVMGNHNELEQVLTNLVLNARDAIRPAKKSGVVNIAFSKSAEWIKVDIRDEGTGIPKEIASKIFDPFFTTKDVGKGVGLGLSICQALIEKHKGMMTFRSEPGRGSVFTIQLPRAEKWDKAGAAKEAVKHEHPQKPLIDKLAKKNILIIDDDGIITKTLCDLLKEAGYYADASQNGFDAVDKTKDAVFDLIIADIKMPGIDGVATIKKIKEASKASGKPDIPTIFITGYADSRAALEAKKIGEVIAKPFDTKEFLAKVAKYI